MGCSFADGFGERTTNKPQSNYTYIHKLNNFVICSKYCCSLAVCLYASEHCLCLLAKYVTFDANNIDKMSDDELWSAFEEAAAAKAACSLKKDKKGEEELAEIITKIRKKLN